jgi:hypothetical protein
VTNTADELDELHEADGADISDELPFSLTKCSEAFFSEDKANFGIHVDVCNNISASHRPTRHGTIGEKSD